MLILELVFDLHNAELNETMERAQGKQFRQDQQLACQWLSVFSNFPHLSSQDDLTLQ